MVVGILENAGAGIAAVKDGKLAHDAALVARGEGNPFDCVLIDRRMPVVDGYGATGQLRHKAYTGPIIALTDYASGTSWTW